MNLPRKYWIIDPVINHYWFIKNRLNSFSFASDRKALSLWRISPNSLIFKVLTVRASRLQAEVVKCWQSQQGFYGQLDSIESQKPESFFVQSWIQIKKLNTIQKYWHVCRGGGVPCVRWIKYDFWLFSLPKLCIKSLYLCVWRFFLEIDWYGIFLFF